MKRNWKWFKWVGVCLLTVLTVGFVIAQPDSSGTEVPIPQIPDNILVLLGWILFGLSEIFAYIPALKANSILQLIFGLLSKLVSKSK